MKATFRLDAINNQMEFSAPDFFLRFAISHTIQSIDKVLEVGGALISYECNGEEDCIYLPDVLVKMGMEWDFTKYEIEVLGSSTAAPYQQESITTGDIRVDVVDSEELGKRVVIATDCNDTTQKALFAVYNNRFFEKASTFRTEASRQQADKIMRANWGALIGEYYKVMPS